MTYAKCPMSDAEFDEARKFNEPFVIGSHVDWARYQAWQQKQVCQHCGAKFSERPKEKRWLTETDCGCEYRESDGSYPFRQA